MTSPIIGYCSNCGTGNTQGSQFCERCGSQLSSQVIAQAPSPYPPQPQVQSSPPPAPMTPPPAPMIPPPAQSSYAPGYASHYAPANLTGRATNGMSIASMVLGILWIWWVGSILALVFGYVALRQIRERNESGKGMAIAGIVLGWVGVGTLAIFIILLIVGAATNHNTTPYR